VARVFVDTNILLYSISKSEPEKQAISSRFLEATIRSGNGFVSPQVLHEFSVNALKKAGAPPATVVGMLSYFEQLNLVPTDFKSVQRALAIIELASLSFWDACILSSAIDANCEQLISEDLNHGQVIGGVRIVNPFLA
jgi:predicted nucleic acid-binding protein